MLRSCKRNINTCKWVHMHTHFQGSRCQIKQALLLGQWKVVMKYWSSLNYLLDSMWLQWSMNMRTLQAEVLPPVPPLAETIALAPVHHLDAMERQYLIHQQRQYSSCLELPLQNQHLSEWLCASHLQTMQSAWPACNSSAPKIGRGWDGSV